MRTSTHPFTCIHIINTDLSTCRPVDLSTYQPISVDNNKDPAVDLDLHLHLYILLTLDCRLVVLSSSRAFDLLLLTLKRIHLPCWFLNCNCGHNVLAFVT